MAYLSDSQRVSIRPSEPSLLSTWYFCCLSLCSSGRERKLGNGKVRRKTIQIFDEEGWCSQPTLGYLVGLFSRCNDAVSFCLSIPDTGRLSERGRLNGLPLYVCFGGALDGLLTSQDTSPMPNERLSLLWPLQCQVKIRN